MLGVAVGLAFAAAGLGVWRVTGESADFIEKIDGSRVEKLSHVRYAGNELILRVTVAEGVVRRPKLGVFRIGFARELVAHDASVEVKVGGQGRKGIAPAELGSVLGELVGAGGERKVDLTSITIERAKLRLLGDAGEWLELRADSWRGGLASRGRIILAGNVVVTTDREERLHFATLLFDPQKASFVAATLSEAHREDDAEAETSLRQVLRNLDCSVKNIIEGTDDSCSTTRKPESSIGRERLGGV